MKVLLAALLGAAVVFVVVVALTFTSGQPRGLAYDEPTVCNYSGMPGYTGPEPSRDWTGCDIHP